MRITLKKLLESLGFEIEETEEKQINEIELEERIPNKNQEFLKKHIKHYK